MILTIYFRKKLIPHFLYEKEGEKKDVTAHVEFVPREGKAVRLPIDTHSEMTLQTVSHINSNMIHKWIVDHTDYEGVNPSPFIIDKTDLLKLQKTCKDVLTFYYINEEEGVEKAKKDLPTWDCGLSSVHSDFGNLEYNELYFETLKEVLEDLNDLFQYPAPERVGNIRFLHHYEYDMLWKQQDSFY